MTRTTQTPSTPKTIKLADQLKASAAIYERELRRIDELSDAEILNLLASASTLDRVLGLASASTLARVLGFASASTLARVLGLASASTLDRVLGLASASTLARVLGLASASALDRVLAKLGLEVPVVENLDQRMYEVTKDGKLDMSQWHCGTTHCRAGWAIAFAGDAGKALEKAVGSEAAGRYIYEASTGRLAPNFFASTKDAAADIARCVGVEA